jgi:hypothetical protein
MASVEKLSHRQEFAPQPFYKIEKIWLKSNPNFWQNLGGL